MFLSVSPDLGHSSSLSVSCSSSSPLSAASVWGLVLMNCLCRALWVGAGFDCACINCGCIFDVLLFFALCFLSFFFLGCSCKLADVDAGNYLLALLLLLLLSPSIHPVKFWQLVENRSGSAFTSQRQETGVTFGGGWWKFLSLDLN